MGRLGLGRGVGLSHLNAPSIDLVQRINSRGNALVMSCRGCSPPHRREDGVPAGSTSPRPSGLRTLDSISTGKPRPVGGTRRIIPQSITAGRTARTVCTEGQNDRVPRRRGGGERELKQPCPLVSSSKRRIGLSRLRRRIASHAAHLYPDRRRVEHA